MGIADGVVQQIIRPTGLVDPQIVVKPSKGQIDDLLEEIRVRVFDSLDKLEWNDDNPLLAGGYVYNMVLQHEYQHNETILQTLQLKRGEPYHAPRATT